MEIIASTFGQAWQDLLFRLLDQPIVEPRGRKTHEALGVSVQVEQGDQNVMVNEVRNLNYRFMVAEWLWIRFGHNDLHSIKQYNRHIANFSDDGETMWGAYGIRIRAQRDYFISTLKNDLVSRQAVVQIWTPNPAKTKDVPCTLSFQGLIRRGKLNLIVNMRSSDIWLGLPYDFFTFSQLAQEFAAKFGVNIGFVRFNLASSHLYLDDYEMALRALAVSTSTVASPTLPGPPPFELDDVFRMRTLSGFELEQPWQMYAKVLLAPTRVQALELLRGKNLA